MSDFRIAWHPKFAHPLPEGHRFPMLKYELLPEQLLHEGIISEEAFFSPLLLSDAETVQTHSPDYLEKLNSLSLSRQEERRTGFPLSDALVEREKLIMQGSIDCALFALKNGVSMNIAGGTHHAYADRGEGFCLLNDIALTANHLLSNELARKVLVVDLDVHQGNGTASLMQNEDRVFTFSMHGASNYPMHKEKSDLDVPLPDGIGDAEYLKLLDDYLNSALDKFEPDFIFYQCGVDILESDKLGRLGLSLKGSGERDKMVLAAAKRHEIPLCAAMGGGYSEDIRIIVDAHAQTFRIAAQLFF